MRENPWIGSVKPKVVSSCFYSEAVSILREQKDWAEIVTPDRYSGWVEKQGLTIRENPYGERQDLVFISQPTAHLYEEKDTEWGPVLTLPFGAKLEVISQPNDLKNRWYRVRLIDDRELYIQRGDVVNNKKIVAIEQLAALSEKFLNIPYTWGGRSSIPGYDCSGFVQMLYGQLGVMLPRDSKDQYCFERLTTIPVEHSSLHIGDLLFFGRKEAVVTHVGMSLGKERFIHACPQENRPCIRISSLLDDCWSGLQDKTDYIFRQARRLKSA